MASRIGASVQRTPKTATARETAFRPPSYHAGVGIPPFAFEGFMDATRSPVLPMLSEAYRTVQATSAPASSDSQQDLDRSGGVENWLEFSPWKKIPPFPYTYQPITVPDMIFVTESRLPEDS